MQTNKELLKNFIDEVIYPSMKRLQENLLLDDEDTIEFLKKNRFLKIASKSLELNSISVEKAVSIEGLNEKLLQNKKIRDAIMFFVSLCKKWAKDNNVRSINYEFIETLENKIKNYTNKNQDDLFDEDDDFFDFDSEEIEDDINSMHYKEYEKISAQEFVQNGEIDDDLIDDIINTIAFSKDIHFHLRLDQELVNEIKPMLSKFIYFFEVSVEFKDLSKVMEKLWLFLDKLDIDTLSDEQQKIGKMLLDTMLEDLEKWVDEVLQKQSAKDIHYLDASFFANIEQLRVMLNQQL